MSEVVTFWPIVRELGVLGLLVLLVAYHLPRLVKELSEINAKLGTLDEKVADALQLRVTGLARGIPGVAGLLLLAALAAFPLAGCAATEKANGGARSAVCATGDVACAVGETVCGVLYAVCGEKPAPTPGPAAHAVVELRVVPMLASSAAAPLPEPRPPIPAPAPFVYYPASATAAPPGAPLPEPPSPCGWQCPPDGPCGVPR